MEFNVDCPVLAVPEKYTFQKIKAVLLSLNYQYNVKTEGLEMLLGIVKKQKAALKILKIEEEIVEVSVPKNDFETLLKGVPSETYCIKNIPSPMAINAFEQLIPVQLHALLPIPYILYDI